MRSNKIYIVGIALLIVIISAIALIIRALPTKGNSKQYQVKYENFVSSIKCKGEINGAKATEINVPNIICDRSLYLYQLKILDLVQEGKSVKKGDFIVQLDQSQIMSMMRNVQQTLEKEQANLNNAKIDSAVKLNQHREEIANSLLDLEYNKIDLEQSVYESEAYQRKAKMKYQKVEIEIAKKNRDYQLEHNKQKLIVSRKETIVSEQNDKLAKYRKAMASCRITTPEDGIVIFAKNWNGKKLGKDDEVNVWMPLIATIPDMSTIISEVYVKEIDIAKISKGDSVSITFDALNDVILSGKISRITSIGENHDDYDMKVFKVKIQIDETSQGLKPGMSSNNEILIGNISKALTVPLNSVFNENGYKYVYLKKSGKIFKRKVETGPENEESVVIKKGLNEGDYILNELPENMKNIVLD